MNKERLMIEDYIKVLSRINEKIILLLFLSLRNWLEYLIVFIFNILWVIIQRLLKRVMKKGALFRLCYLMILILLLEQSQSQGGRMPSNRGSHSQHHTAPYDSPNHGQPHPTSHGSCKIVNGVKSCASSTKSTASQGNNFNYLLIATVLMIIGFIYTKKREIWVLKDIYKRQMQNFQQKILEIPCKIKQADLTNKMHAFQNTTFKMDDIRKDKIEHYKCEMRIVNMEKIKDRIYQVKYQCKDINGQSTLQGLVGIISQNQYGVKFVKIYKKFTEMGEKTKKIKNLMFYQGKGSLKELNGEWHFIGYQDTETHSGKWKMIST